MSINVHIMDIYTDTLHIYIMNTHPGIHTYTGIQLHILFINICIYYVNYTHTIHILYNTILLVKMIDDRNINFNLILIKMVLNSTVATIFMFWWPIYFNSFTYKHKHTFICICAYRQMKKYSLKYHFN